VRKYFILVTNEDGAGWGVEFGDYNRQTVLDEQTDYCDGGIPKRLTKVLAVEGDTQAAIDEVVRKLNA